MEYDNMYKYVAYQKSPMGLTEKKRGSLYWDILDFFKKKRNYTKEMFDGI